MPDGFKSVSDALRLRELGQRLDEVSDRADYAGLLTDLDLALPVQAATPDLPLFTLAPTTLEERARWHDLLSAYRIDDDVMSRLLSAGFVVLDRESAEFGVVGDPFPSTITSRYLLLDSDYATLLLPPRDGRLANRSLTPLVFLRYQPHYPILAREPSALYSVGAIRGHLGYHGALRGNYFEPVEVSVSSRSELDDVVARVRANLADRPDLTIWFRGQTCEYLTDDLTAAAELGICPWRTLRDPSLAPSLCRRLSGLWGDWGEYASVLLEFGWLGTFLESALDIPASEIRAPADLEPPERLGSEWPAVEFSSFRSTGEVRDYHQSFRGLQKLFFFQHYGLPSNVLDITKDLDVGLFFANYRIQDGRYVSVGRDPSRVLYILILQQGLDQFLDSRDVSEQCHLLRPLRQECGLIAGASMVNRNVYARYVSIRVRLEGDIEQADLSPDYLFPAPHEDEFLRRLLDFQEERGLTRVRPFVLAQ